MKSSSRCPPGLRIGLNFLAPTRLARGDERLALIDPHWDVKDGRVGKFLAPVDREIALFDVETRQTGRRRLGDETEEDAAGILNSFAKFGFPVLPWLDLLLVKPDKEPFVLKLFDYEFGDRQIRRSVTDKDTSGGAMSEAMGLFHNECCRR